MPFWVIHWVASLIVRYTYPPPCSLSCSPGGGSGGRDGAGWSGYKLPCFANKKPALGGCVLPGSTSLRVFVISTASENYTNLLQRKPQNKLRLQAGSRGLFSRGNLTRDFSLPFLCPLLLHYLKGKYPIHHNSLFTVTPAATISLALGVPFPYIALATIGKALRRRDLPIINQGQRFASLSRFLRHCRFK